MVFQTLLSASLLLALMSCSKKSGDSNEDNELPNNRVPIETSSGAFQAPSNDASEAGSHALSASCTGQEFSLRITADGKLKTLSLDKIEKCAELAKILDGITLPNGKTPETLTGGPSVEANCVEGKFDLKSIQAENTTSTVTVFDLNGQFCKELRSIVNAAKL
jgi:hypothetical protein